MFHLFLLLSLNAHFESVVLASNPGQPSPGQGRVRALIRCLKASNSKAQLGTLQVLSSDDREKHLDAQTKLMSLYNQLNHLEFLNSKYSKNLSTFQNDWIKNQGLLTNTKDAIAKSQQKYLDSFPTAEQEKSYLAKELKSIFNKQLAPGKVDAVYRSLKVGRGEEGHSPHSIAEIGNYTVEQGKRKKQILLDAGFKLEEIKKLEKTGILEDKLIQPQNAFYEGSLTSILRRDRFTLGKLKDRGKLLDGMSSPYLYETQDGFKFVIKEVDPRYSSAEVAAYIVDKRLRLNLIPQTEEIHLEGKLFSVQKYVRSDFVEILGDPEIGLPPQSVEIAAASENPIPDSIVLIDALIGNYDRSTNGGNYLILTPHKVKGPINPNKLINIKDPHFVAIDHAVSFTEDLSIREWVSIARQHFSDDRPYDKQFQSVLRRNPDFVSKLKGWPDSKIRQDLGLYLRPQQIQKFIERKNEIIQMANSNGR